MRLSRKLLIAFLLIGTVPLAITLFMTQWNADDALTDAAEQKLQSLQASKGAEVRRYFENIRDQVLTFSQNRMIVDAMKEYRGRFRAYRDENKVTPAQIESMRASLETYYRDEFNNEFMRRNDGASSDWQRYFQQLDDDSIALQFAYIKDNPNPLGEKHNMDAAPDESAYSGLHRQIHPVVRSYLEKFGYYDIFLVDPDTGDILYSVFKELDYSTSLKDGPYSETNFGRCFREANRLGSRDGFVFVDFEPYPPSYMDAASFIASPIYDGDTKLGVAIFQMPVDRINEIMNSREGLGQTGELFLAGKAAGGATQLRSSRVDIDGNAIADIGSPITGEDIKIALSGQPSKGTRTIDGAAYLVTAAPLEILGTSWAVCALQAEAEALAAVSKLTWSAVAIAVFSIIVIAVVTPLLTRSIVLPIRKAADVMSKIAAGNLRDRVGLKGKGDLARFTQDLDGFADNMTSFVSQLDKIAGGDLTVEIASNGENDQIAPVAQKMVTNLRELVTEVRQTTDQVASGAEEVSSASQSLSQGATEQAASLEEITSSTTEIGSQAKVNADNSEQANRLMNDTRSVVDKGMSAGKDMASAMSEIQDSSEQIRKIIKVIDDIAFQTNLLALNAAVEAARAGRHGKGFAVVAEEVRSLAGRSAKAAQETAQLIEEAVARTENGAALARELDLNFEEIVQSAQKVGDIVAEISASSREQAEGVSQVNSGLNQIDGVTQQNTASAEQTASASQQLRHLADNLRAQLNQFRLTDVATRSAVVEPSREPKDTRPASQLGISPSAWGGSSLQMPGLPGSRKLPYSA